MFRHRTLLLVALSALAASFAMGQLSRSSRQIPIGNSDFNGFARIDKMFYGLPLGNGRKADMFFKFTTDPRYEPKYMGAYWTIPFFDSSVIKTGPTRYVWRSPNHGTYTFNKAAKADKGFGETYILNTTGNWKLNVGKGEILISEASDAKSRYLFRDGRLVSFCAGDGADSFRISYDSKGYPLSVYNVTKHAEAVKFNYGAERELAGISFPAEKKSVLITYAPYSVYGENGDIARGLKSASSITFLDGRRETYLYRGEGRKTRKAMARGGKEASAEVAVNRFLQKLGEGGEGFIDWDAESGLIMSDSGGEYEICNPLFDLRNPDSNGKISRSFGSNTKESRISYKKPEYEYAQIWDYSSRSAIKITQDPDTGEQTRTSYIGMPGKASMKIRKIEKRLSGEKDWNLTLSKMYDENGNILRIFEPERISEYTYKVLSPNTLEKKIFLNGILKEVIITSSSGDLLEQTKYFENKKKEVVKNLILDGKRVQHFYEGDELIYKKYFSKSWKESDLISKEDNDGTTTIYNYKDKIREELICYPNGDKVLNKYDNEKKEFIELKNSDIILDWIQNAIKKEMLK